MRSLFRRFKTKRNSLSERFTFDKLKNSPIANPWILFPLGSALSGLAVGSLYYHTLIAADNYDGNYNNNNNNNNRNRRIVRRRERQQYNEELCLAVRNLDYKLVSELLSSSSISNPDGRSKYGWCPLHIAVVNQDISMIKLLLSAGADVNIADMTSPYIGSIRSELFSDKIRVNAPTQGFTPLHYAVSFFNKDIVKLLIENGADAYNIKDSGGYTCIDWLDEKIPKAAEILDIIDYETQIYSLNRSEREREMRLKYPIEKELKKKIVGQLLPINNVSSAIRRKLNGWYDPEHSNLVFLFLGSSGVGKTELAKTLANILHKDDKNGFIRIDMTEFQHKHEVSKFIGSPPGYVGHEEGGQLTKKLKQFPNAIVLLDEVEKAHPDILTVMLQLFDEGRITDGKGETVHCKDAIFIMTSNLAQTEIGDESENLRKEGLNLNKDKDEPSDETVTLSKQFIENTIQPILKNHFRRDEFLGRINEILYFLPFNETELKELIIKELDKWSDISYNKHSINLNWNDSAIDILKDGYNFRYGARSIQHEVEKRVINQLAKLHENGKIQTGSIVNIDGDTDKGLIKLEFDNSNVSNTTKSKSRLISSSTNNVDDNNKKNWFW